MISLNDEIKEILEELENMYEISELEEQVNNINRIKDYITNLQQAVKDTKDTADNMLYELKQENERLKEWKEDLLKENIELENIRKEAIEYIEKEIYYCLSSGDNINIYLDRLLNILQNGSDDNEKRSSKNWKIY